MCARSGRPAFDRGTCISNSNFARARYHWFLEFRILSLCGDSSGSKDDSFDSFAFEDRARSFEFRTECEFTRSIHRLLSLCGDSSGSKECEFTRSKECEFTRSIRRLLSLCDFTRSIRAFSTRPFEFILRDRVRVDDPSFDSFAFEHRVVYLCSLPVTGLSLSNDSFDSFASEDRVVYLLRVFRFRPYLAAVLPEQQSTMSEDEAVLGDLLDYMDKDDAAQDFNSTEWKQHVEGVAKASTSTAVRKTYRSHLTRFAKFLYNVEHPALKGALKKEEKSDYDLLHADLVAELDAVPRPTKQKTKKKKKTESNKFRKALRNVTLQHLEKASPEYHPIDLQRLQPKVFLEHLLNLTDTLVNKEYLKSYGSHRSALTMLFLDCGVTRREQFLQVLSRLMKGLKNTSAKERGAQGARLTEGKEPLPFVVYCAICRWLLEKGDKASIFALCFLTLTWNLMCRSKNTTLVQRDHISWEGDAAGIQFAHSKTDTGGDEAAHIRHVYANPHNPAICPLLALARYLILFPGRDTGPLFHGSAQYDRFRQILSDLVAEHRDDILRMGIDPDEIGVHSIRKGAATYCTSGTTSGISFAALCVRAGWSMGGVKDRYIKYAEAGDRVCGRTVTGLDVNSHEFSISPALLDVSAEEEKKVDSAKQLLFGPTPAKWGLLTRFLLASLLFHREWMDKTSGPDFLSHSRFFEPNDLYEDLVKKTKTCYPWTAAAEVRQNLRIDFKGLPQAVVDFNYHRQQLDKLQQLPQIIVDALVEKLDERNIGGGELTLSKLREELIKPLEKKLDEKLNALNLSTKPSSERHKLVSQDSPDRDKRPSSVAKFASLPSNYELDQKGSCLVAWEHWHHGKYHRKAGNSNGGFTTPPWKTLTVPQLKQGNTHKGYLNNLRFLCRQFDAACGISEKQTPPKEQLSEHFKSRAIMDLLEKLDLTKGGKASRYLQNNWETTSRALRKRLSSLKKGEALPKARTPKKRPAPLTTPKRQRKKSKTGNDDDDDEVTVMSPSSMKAFDRPAKGSDRATSQNGRRWEVPGPSRLDEDCGRLVLCEFDRDSLHHQGCMLTGVTTTAFHNLTCNHYYMKGVRCTESDFVPDLQLKLRENGEAHGWHEYLTVLSFRESGSYNLPWETQKVILIQVFWGPRESGHFASLIVDRTRKGNALAVYADSLTDFQPNAIEILKEMLQSTPLDIDEMTWIKASVPKQGRLTNDCGVISSCFSLLYVRGLEKDGLLKDGLLAQSSAGRHGDQVRAVSLELPKSMNMHEFGHAGRSCMSKATKHAKLDFNSDIFRAKVRWS